MLLKICIFTQKISNKMIIANPIYDVVFKKLMENEKVAKFFIGTLLEQTIVAVEVKPQEYTYEGEMDTSEGIKAIEKRIRERFSIWIYRLDFIATIKTETGELKKVLIEIQKARNLVDLVRFRNYLGEQYKKQDIIDNQKETLPITTIYILGFKLPDIETPCIKVERNYIDLIDRKIINTKSDFVEKLTHDSFIVQVGRITERYQTHLDKLLSVFEQRNFTDSTEVTKQFTHLPDVEEVKMITDILHYTGTEPAEKKKIENEQEAWRTINAMFEETENGLLKAINEKEQIITEKEQIITEKEQIITEKSKAIEERDRIIDELKRKLGGGGD
jgi:hypothetical protein